MAPSFSVPGRSSVGLMMAASDAGTDVLIIACDAANASKLGVGDYDRYLSIALGAGDTTVLKLTNAYAVLANNGRSVSPTLIDYVQDRNGKVINLLAVKDDDEVMMITKDGQIVRTKVSEISVIGRNTQGVRCIALNKGDKLVSVARIPNEDPEPSETTAKS